MEISRTISKQSETQLDGGIIRYADDALLSGWKLGFDELLRVLEGRIVIDPEQGDPDHGRGRGVPSATMERQIELYTADATVTILSGDAGLRRRAAQDLRAIRRGDPPARLPPRLMRAKRLPAPLRGAMNGSLRCDRASMTPGR